MGFTQADKDALTSGVSAAFGDLDKAGFRRNEVQLCSTPALGEYLETRIERLNSDRSVSIALTRTPDGSREALTISLERGSADTFSLTTYLKYLGASEETIKNCKLSAYHGSLNERILLCLRFARHQIDQRLLGALKGEEWPEIPMDWADYK
jgi:hypothetical protein